jgi:hypothetical protein
MEEEIWKQCGVGAERYSKWIYEVSNQGNFRVVDYSKEPRILKQHLNSKGYFRGCIANKKVLIHHLVANAFMGERPEGLVIDHIDRNPKNNHISNLRYVTHKENQYNSKLAIDKRQKDVKYICKCGGVVNNQNNRILRHEKTEKHKKYVESLL